MAFFAYLLRCMDGSFYCGHTDNLELRLAEHQTGACGGYTASRLPVALVWSQDFATREEALASERQIKGWSRAKKEALIAGDWAAINRLGRGKHKHERNLSTFTHPSTSEAALPTLRTNGGPLVSDPQVPTASSVRPESFAAYSVRLERSEAKSKDERNKPSGQVPSQVLKAKDE
ncbi:hypothetical protein DLREEDagrD3_00420 [Denitratisoma sp. agr-D3]